MERDTKNKHRISDARWRDSVSRCYNLLKQCCYAERDSTRMSILKMTLDQIHKSELHLEEIGLKDLVESVFGQGEAITVQQQQEQAQLQQQQQSQQ